MVAISMGVAPESLASLRSISELSSFSRTLNCVVFMVLCSVSNDCDI